MTYYSCTGGCHCGNIRFSASFVSDPTSMSPRACDCDYCRMHAAAYLSDPQGRLEITIRHGNEVAHYRQGGNLAAFTSCRICGVLVAVSHSDDGVIYGAINSKAVAGGMAFADPKTVSPKLLGNEEKVGRWKELWFPDVSIKVAEV